MPVVEFLHIMCYSYIGAKRNGRGLSVVVMNGKSAVAIDVVLD